MWSYVFLPVFFVCSHVLTKIAKVKNCFMPLIYKNVCNNYASYLIKIHNKKTDDKSAIHRILCWFYRKCKSKIRKKKSGLSMVDNLPSADTISLCFRISKRDFFIFIFWQLWLFTQQLFMSQEWTTEYCIVL